MTLETQLILIVFVARFAREIFVGICAIQDFMIALGRVVFFGILGVCMTMVRGKDRSPAVYELSRWFGQALGARMALVGSEVFRAVLLFAAVWSVHLGAGSSTDVAIALQAFQLLSIASVVFLVWLTFDIADRAYRAGRLCFVSLPHRNDYVLRTPAGICQKIPVPPPKHHLLA